MREQEKYPLKAHLGKASPHLQAAALPPARACSTPAYNTLGMPLVELHRMMFFAIRLSTGAAPPSQLRAQARSRFFHTGWPPRAYHMYVGSSRSMRSVGQQTSLSN